MMGACKQGEKQATGELQTSEVANHKKPSGVPSSWIARRVAKASERLQASNAGKIVWKAMEAHGGLAEWYTNGPISFRFTYTPLDGGTVRDSYQTIDNWRNLARHFSVADSSDQFGYTGDTHWTMVRDSTVFPYDTKFWALTPYYFLAQPFVLDGEGVQLEQLPDLVFEGRPQSVVKVGFEPGTGDAPDDYYILYFDKEDHLLRVIRYIVSYPEYFKDGGHSPEKFMVLTGSQNSGDFILPTGYRTYWTAANDTRGAEITRIIVGPVDFGTRVSAGFFDKPTEAKVLRP